MDPKDLIIQQQALRIRELEALVEKLMARIDELERRLALNSTNSSKPPSSDGLQKKPAPKSLREKTGKKFGGQEGHTGNTLRQVDEPDDTIEYDVATCTSCGASLVEVAAEDIIERQVFDLEIRRKVTAHRSAVKKCQCGKRNINMPQDINAPVQYGHEVRALAVYLANQFVPKDRASEFFRDVCNIPVSDTTLMAFDAECAQNLVPFHDALLVGVMASDIAYFDETGFRINGKTSWGHVSSTDQLTHYRISEKRGDIIVDFAGIAVHDHFGPYNKMVGATHVFCNAHHMRELKAIFEIDGEIWSWDLYNLLKNASWLNEPAANHIDQISCNYDQILNAGLAIHDKPMLRNVRYKKSSAHNLILRLIKYKTESLRFLYDARVPFTNNQAERDLRMIKLKQKVSGCFRTVPGAHGFAITRSFISTARKQQKNVYAQLKTACKSGANLSEFAFG